jgi:glycosyltransferase involved in cell wall biosynthesis
LGSTLLDAIDFGLPVIARDVGGIPDIIEHGENGYLVSGEDPDFLTPLIELYSGMSTRDEMSEKNRKKSDQFSIERMTESYISLYNQYL